MKTEITEEVITPSLITNDPAPQSHPITLVSSYFKLQNSKHSFESYLNWLEKLYTRIKTPIVVYTSTDLAPKFKKLRGNLPIEIITEYSSPLEIPFVKGGPSAAYANQRNMDPESGIHNVELYAVWNSKTFLVAQAIKLNKFNSKYFFWVDSGCFREDHKFSQWPNVEIVESILGGKESESSMLVHSILNANDVLSDLSSVNWDETLSSLHNNIAGTFFGGSIKALEWWNLAFYKLHDEKLANGEFVGKDQKLMNKLVLMNKNRIYVSTPKIHCHDVWFQFQTNLASSDELYPGCSYEPNHSVIRLSSDK